MIVHAIQSKPARTKRCKHCRGQFVPTRPLQSACGPVCAQRVAERVREKAERRKAAQERKAIREAKDRIKTRSEWMKEAQAAFNKFIRARDAALPCICCGEFGPDEAWKPGGQWDAGHFLGVGAYPELRFVEDNCHKQLKSCNAGSGKYARKGRTVAQEYEERLIQKIGIERVELLKGPHEPKHYSIDDLKVIRDTYRRKALEIARAAR